MDAVLPVSGDWPGLALGEWRGEGQAGRESFRARACVGRAVCKGTAPVRQAGTVLSFLPLPRCLPFCEH